MLKKENKVDLFLHHIYEYKNGLRRMVLHTAPASSLEAMTGKLLSLGIAHIVDPVNEWKINIFFGDPWCIEVVRSFRRLNLSGLTDEQDFMLGTLLGYDTLVQCRRYLRRKNQKDEVSAKKARFTGRVAEMGCAYAN